MTAHIEIELKKKTFCTLCDTYKCKYLPFFTLIDFPFQFLSFVFTKSWQLVYQENAFKEEHKPVVLSRKTIIIL